MADSPKLSLDKDGLNNFIDHELVPLISQLANIQKDDDAFGPSMGTIVGKGVTSGQSTKYMGLAAPLAIGSMSASGGMGDGTGDLTAGSELNAQIVKMAQSIVDVYTLQGKLLGDIKENLHSTVDALFDGQHGSLTDIDGQAFLDGLGVVPDDFQGSGSSGGGS
ncbi:type VII secretion system-associated protein [Streptomyces fuscichromogenes]|uniref:type VII secretion system-associated protein n=1 Tax=Streptomyces fuscichromogenes TaxID=1324013 RepID=UPI00382011CD